MEYLNQTKKKFPKRITKTTLRNKTKLRFGDEVKNIRVVRKTGSLGSLESESMEYTIFRNLKHR